MVVYSTYLTVEVVEEQEELEGSIKVAWVMKGEYLEGEELEVTSMVAVVEEKEGELQMVA